MRPPGAIGDDEIFSSACERCHKCADACPFDVIHPLGPLAGRMEGTPVVDPNLNPCRWCANMDCIRACPSGALAFGENETAAPIGTAQVNTSTCILTEGILCDECVAVCPSDVEAMSIVDREPHLEEDLCVGCGLCVMHCPSTPVSIHVALSGGAKIGKGEDGDAS